MLQLEVREGDIAQVEADAIANAANDHLWMGDEIEHEAMAQGPIELGSAVATSAGRLHARYVVHGAVMGQDLRTNAEFVRKTTHSCLGVADRLGCRSLALPAFGTGIGGFPLDECARIMIGEARSFEPRSLEHVLFAVRGQDAEAAFQAALTA